MKTGFLQWNALRSLNSRPFGMVWGGQSFSRIGDFVYEVALAWWVLEKTGSAGQMAAVLTCFIAPVILFSLFGGVVVDRLPRLRVMLASDLLRGGMVLLIAGLAFAQRLEIWHIYFLSAGLGLVDAFFQPAFSASVPGLVDETQLPSANTLISLSMQMGRIAGPLIGAGLIAWGGTSLAFAVDSLTFFIAGAFLLPLVRKDASPRGAGEEGGGSLLGDVKEGLRIVFSLPWLWISILVFAFTNITLSGPYSVALPFLVKDALHGDAGLLGLIYTLFASGYVLGSLWMGQKPKIRGRGRLIYAGVALAGLMLLVIGLPVGIIGILIAALVNGAALEVATLAWINTLQERIPPDKLGRVFSLDTIGSYALIPVGYGLAGLAAPALGAPLVFVLGGGLTALMALLGYLHPAVRRLD